MNNYQQPYYPHHGGGHAMQQQQQQQLHVQGGILPPALLTALDRLVDRLNGDTYGSSAANSGGQGGMIRALLVGTNEGVGLSRSFGSASTSLSEEVISSIETMYATLPSSTPPHVMAAAAAVSSSEEDDSHQQPPHPLLSPLSLGDYVKTVTAFYDNCTLVHLHMPPLVVTFLAHPNANIGAIRSTALPLLQKLLEPVRRAILVSRREAATAAASAAANSNAYTQSQYPSSGYTTTNTPAPSYYHPTR